MQDDNSQDLEAKRGSKFSNTTKTLSNKKNKRSSIGLNFIENFYQEIPNIVQIFFNKNIFKSKIQTFIKQCPYKEGFDYLIAVIKNFPEFNIFDYLSDDIAPPSDQIQTLKRREFYNQRNDLFFNILIYNKLNKENDNCMDKQVEYFVKINNENVTSINYEVDYFFLTILGYRDKAKSILVKQHEYLKNFIKCCKDVETVNFFQKLNIDKKPIDMTIEEIVIIRKIINSIVLRRYYNGLIFLLTRENIFLLMMEGRIWKSIITEFTKEEALETYINYCYLIKQYLHCYDKYESQDIMKDVKRKLYLHTLSFEYEAKIKELKEEEDSILEKEIMTKDLHEFETLVKHKDAIIQEREELEKEIGLPSIFNFVDLLKIIFIYNKKEVALAILDSSRTDIKPTIEIFEICLNHDEDIAM